MVVGVQSLSCVRLFATSWTPQFKSIDSLMLSLLYGPTFISVHDNWKNHSFDCMDIGSEMMCLLINNMLPRFDLMNWCLWTVVMEKTLQSLEQQGDQTSQSWRKWTLNTHWKDWYWSCNSNILVTWCKLPTHWKSPWCLERLRAEGEEGVRGIDG